MMEWLETTQSSFDRFSSNSGISASVFFEGSGAYKYNLYAN